MTRLSGDTIVLCFQLTLRFFWCCGWLALSSQLPARSWNFWKLSHACSAGALKCGVFARENVLISITRAVVWDTSFLIFLFNKSLIVALPFEVALVCHYLINKLEEFESNAAVVLSASLKSQPFTQVQVEGEANCYWSLLISLQSTEKQSLPS